MIDISDKVEDFCDIADKEEFDTKGFIIGISVILGSALCERLELLTAAVERVGDGTSCQSCGADIQSSQEGATCRGCGDIVCQSCTDVWQHFEGGKHGNGNPAEEVTRLRAIEAKGTPPGEETDNG